MWYKRKRQAPCLVLASPDQWRAAWGPHHPFCGLECLTNGPQLVPRFAHLVFSPKPPCPRRCDLRFGEVRAPQPQGRERGF